MTFRVQARTDRVTVGLYFHGLDEHPSSTEWWPRSCVAFSTFGSWQVGASRGSGQVSPATVLAATGSSEYDCRHPEGADDRMLAVVYHDEPDLGPALLVPRTGSLRALTRAVAAQADSRDIDGNEIDSLCDAIADAVAVGADCPPSPSPRSRAVVQRLRAIADEYYADATLDLVAEAAGLGVSRTRFIHTFRDVTGLTPHRYLVGRRTSHAARQLAASDATVAEICFAVGFGTLASFQKAFTTAFGTTPTSYRAARVRRTERAQSW